ncbi:hypothetical protein ACFTWR_06430 [Streptomyces nigra]|uniref:hypothetical protein n=1 Tax=Streptomyces nigra TaxID=1827580 RepID=UPI003626415C
MPDAVFWIQLITALAIFEIFVVDLIRYPVVWLPRILLTVLIVDGLVFLISAGIDVSKYPGAQAATAVLRFVIGLLNLAAWRVVYRQGPGTDPWALKIVPIAQAAAIPMLFIPVWIELRSPIRDTWEDNLILGVAVLLLLYAVIGVIFGLTHGHIEFGWIAVGSLLPLAGAVQFWYLSFYKPVHDRPSVDVAVNIKKLNSLRYVERLQVSVTLKNNGSAAVDVLEATYAAMGYDITGKAMRVHDVLKALDENSPHGLQYGRYRAILRVDRLIPAGGSLAPGQKWSSSFVFDASASKQDAVRLNVNLSVLTHTGYSKPVGCQLSKKKKHTKDLYLCTQMEFPKQSLVREVLGDRPIARNVTRISEGAPPYVETRYLSAERLQAEEREAEAVDSLIRDETIETVAEYRLDP